MFGKIVSLFFVILLVSGICSASVSQHVIFDNRLYTSNTFFPFRTDPNILESVEIGTSTALKHCQDVFHWDRWNCPKEEFERHSKHVNINKEAAYTQAIVAAGIVHSITKNCSKGEFVNCGCNPKYNPSPRNYFKAAMSPNAHLPEGSPDSRTNVTWKWGGCSDDVTFGTRVARHLLEKPDKGMDIPSFVARKNYEVGIEIVNRHMIKKCRCHGVSGSCSLQTCWMSVAPFQHVAKKLKEKYHKAFRLSQDNIKIAYDGANHPKSQEDLALPAPHMSLVYTERSPDYCVPNAELNWPGTKQRVCSKNKSNQTTIAEKRSCKKLCRQCGYKLRKEKRMVKTLCNCSFEWCCSVKCSTCTQEVEEYYCY